MRSDYSEFNAVCTEYSGAAGQLDELNSSLIQAYRSYNETDDPVVMEHCVSEMNTLRARRNDLMRRLRKSAPK